VSEPAHPKVRHVLITTAIVVRMPDGDDDGFTYAEPFTDKMREAIVDAFRGSPAVEYPEAMTFVWLDEPDVNVGRCAGCDCWVSDYTRPETLQGIAGGRLISGRWLCDECETFGEETDDGPMSGNG
jgi:hypothetical protein